jgi:hypothetical protein
LPPPQYHPLLANPQHGSNSEAAAVWLGTWNIL